MSRFPNVRFPGKGCKLALWFTHQSCGLGSYRSPVVFPKPEGIDGQTQGGLYLGDLSEMQTVALLHMVPSSARQEGAPLLSVLVVAA